MRAPRAGPYLNERRPGGAYGLREPGELLHGLRRGGGRGGQPGREQPPATHRAPELHGPRDQRGVGWIQADAGVPARARRHRPSGLAAVVPPAHVPRLVHSGVRADLLEVGAARVLRQEPPADPGAQRVGPSVAGGARVDAAQVTAPALAPTGGAGRARARTCASTRQSPSGADAR